MSRRSVLAAAACAAAAVSVFGMRPAEPDDVAKLRQEVAELKAALADHTLAATKTAEDVSCLSRTSPPVGAVVAFAGAWPPRRGDGPPWKEADLGWLLCDGRPWNHDTLAEILEPQRKELAVVLGGSGLPDYRGYFLRGLDKSSFTGAASRDKGPLRLVGNEQGCATRRPTGDQPFMTDISGEHTHPMRMEMTATRSAENGKISMTVTGGNVNRELLPVGMGGRHTHQIIGGGDPETRPINVAVYWIVKFK